MVAGKGLSERVIDACKIAEKRLAERPKLFSFNGLAYHLSEKARKKWRQSLQDALLSEWKAPKNVKFSLSVDTKYLTKNAMQRYINDVLPKTNDYRQEVGFQ